MYLIGAATTSSSQRCNETQSLDPQQTLWGPSRCRASTAHHHLILPAMDSPETFRVTSPLRSDGNLCGPCAPRCGRSSQGPCLPKLGSQLVAGAGPSSVLWKALEELVSQPQASESSEINSFFEKLTSELWVREAKFSWAHYRIVCTKLPLDLFTSPWEVIQKWLRYRYRCEHTLRFDAAGRNWTDPFKMIYDIWYYIIPTQSQMIS